jgi:hypothetical protein
MGPAGLILLLSTSTQNRKIAAAALSAVWEISISCRLIIVLFQEVSPKAVEKPLFVAWLGLVCHRRGSQQSRFGGRFHTQR